MTKRTTRTDVLALATTDQHMWSFNAQHSFAYRLHGRHLAIVEACIPEMVSDWRFSIRDVLTGHTTVHGDSHEPAWALLESMNVALSEAERKHKERLRDDRA